MTNDIVTAKLDLEQLSSETEQSKPITMDVWAYFAEHGYPVESIVEAHSVVSRKMQEENTGHIVTEIETLEKPLNRADVAVDQCTIFCCDCRDYQFNQGVDLDQESITEWGHCKHCKSVMESNKYL